MKTKKRKIDRCDVCGRRIRNMDDDALFQVIRPKGLSYEVFRDAALKAQEQEEHSPAKGPERWAYMLISMGIPFEDENERVVAGRAFQALGFRLVQFHKACKESVPDSNEYVTEEWLKYNDAETS